MTNYDLPRIFRYAIGCNVAVRERHYDLGPFHFSLSPRVDKKNETIEDILFKARIRGYHVNFLFNNQTMPKKSDSYRVNIRLVKQGPADWRITNDLALG